MQRRQALTRVELGVEPERWERREEEDRCPVEAGAFQCYVTSMYGKTFAILSGPVRAVRFVDDTDRTGARQPEQGRRPGPDHDVHVSVAGGLVDGDPATAQAAVVRGYGVSLIECHAQEIHQPF